MKMSRDEALFAVRDSVTRELKEKLPNTESHLVVSAFWSTCREVLQENVLERQIRWVRRHGASEMREFAQLGRITGMLSNHLVFNTL